MKCPGWIAVTPSSPRTWHTRGFSKGWDTVGKESFQAPLQDLRPGRAARAVGVQGADGQVERPEGADAPRHEARQRGQPRSDGAAAYRDVRLIHFAVVCCCDDCFSFFNSYLCFRDLLSILKLIIIRNNLFYFLYLIITFLLFYFNTVRR